VKYLPLLLLNMEALPIIGVLGEFDALPGSQKAQTQALNSGAAGHGCGICLVQEELRSLKN
jgi:hypothetical protein